MSHGITRGYFCLPIPTRVGHNRAGCPAGLEKCAPGHSISVFDGSPIGIRGGSTRPGSCFICTSCLCEQMLKRASHFGQQTPFMEADQMRSVHLSRTYKIQQSKKIPSGKDASPCNPVTLASAFIKGRRGGRQVLFRPGTSGRPATRFSKEATRCAMHLREPSLVGLMLTIFKSHFCQSITRLNESDELRKAAPWIGRGPRAAPCLRREMDKAAAQPLGRHPRMTALARRPWSASPVRSMSNSDAPEAQNSLESVVRRGRTIARPDGLSLMSIPRDNDDAMRPSCCTPAVVADLGAGRAKLACPSSGCGEDEFVGLRRGSNPRSSLARRLRPAHPAPGANTKHPAAAVIFRFGPWFQLAAVAPLARQVEADDVDAADTAPAETRPAIAAGRPPSASATAVRATDLRAR